MLSNDNGNITNNKQKTSKGAKRRNDYITVLKSARNANKVFNTKKNILHHNGAPPIYDANAKTVKVTSVEQMKRQIEIVSDDPKKVIILGYIEGTKDGQVYRILSEGKMMKATGKKDVTSGVFQTKDKKGRSRDTYCRSKQNFSPSAWVLLDYDGDNPKLTEQKSWLQKMSHVYGEEFKNSEKVIIPSNSFRIEGDNLKPRPYKHHCFIRLDNVQGIERFKGLGVDYMNRTNEALFDQACFQSNRIVYDGKPTVTTKGLSVSATVITLIEGNVYPSMKLKSQSRGVLSAENDPILVELKEQGYEPKPRSNGNYELTTCPFSHNHTDPNDVQGSFYSPVGVGLKDSQGSWHCNHEGCQGLYISDLMDHLDISIEDFFNDTGMTLKSGASVIQPHEVAGRMSEFFISKRVAGDPHVFQIEPDSLTDEALSVDEDYRASARMAEGDNLHRLSRQGFNMLLAPYSVEVPDSKNKDKTKLTPLADYWLRSLNRTELKGIEFDPSGQLSPDYYNTWEGFKTKPIEGDWSKMQWHLLNIICDRNTELYEYTLNWFAFLFQFPHRQHGSVLVFLSPEEGTGKSIVTEMISAMVGKHSLNVNNSHAVTGNFNSSLGNSVFMVANEAIFHGDRKATSVLKDLITGDNLTIERKGEEKYTSPNMLSMIWTGNEHHAIHAEKTSRRYTVYGVSADKRKDEDYFNALCDERDDGGKEAMMFDLLARDISKFRSGSICETQALEDQKAESRGDLESWLFDCCDRESMFQDDDFDDDKNAGFDSNVPNSKLWESYYSFIGNQRYPTIKSSTLLNTQITTT